MAQVRAKSPRVASVHLPSVPGSDQADFVPARL